MARTRILKGQKWQTEDSDSVTVTNVSRGVVYYRRDRNFSDELYISIPSFLNKFLFVTQL